MSEEEDEKNKTISFRVDEETREELREVDKGLSELYRGMTDLYLNDPFFANGINTYLDNKVENFEEYAAAYFEASAEHRATELIGHFERAVDPQELKEPLRDYLAAVTFGDKNWAEESADEIYEIDEVLGTLFKNSTQRLPEDQWDDYLE